MRRIFCGLAFLAAACSSSQDDIGPDGTGPLDDAGTSTGGAAATGGATGSGGAKATGGATGSGGAYLTDGGAPCTSLPASGTWQSIAPFSAGGSDFGAGFSEAISVDPFDPGILWLGTGAKGIYKSTDCGATFMHVNTGRNADVFERGNHISMIVDPVDRGVIFVANIHYSTNLWKSTNGGVDWDPVFATGSEVDKTAGSQADSVSMDPTDHRHLVVGFHSNCAAPYAPACEAETTDSGATWRIVKAAWGGWEEGAGPWVIDATTRLFGGTHLWLTTNSGTDWTNLDPDPAQYWGLNGGEVETHSIPHGADGSYYLTAGQGVVRSTDGGHSWSLISTSGGQTVAFVIGGGNLYTSNQWSASIHTAPESDPTKWTAMTAPNIPSGQGCPYLDYDVAHHVLYASCYAAGLWRTVTP